MAKRKITVGGFLRLLNDVGEEWMWIVEPKGLYRAVQGSGIIKPLEDYFPSAVERAAGSLLREGWVEKKETPEGVMVKITDRGKKQVLMFKLRELAAKKGRWDGRWRMVFFDIAEVERKKRNVLRGYLKQLGLRQMQESVWISPWEVRDEIKYLREILDVPHGVKWGVLTEIENEAELKEWFRV